MLVFEQKTRDEKKAPKGLVVLVRVLKPDIRDEFSPDVINIGAAGAVVHHCHEVFASLFCVEDGKLFAGQVNDETVWHSFPLKSKLPLP